MHPRLWRFAYGLTRRHAAADDLTQATCLRALEKARLFKKDTSADRWIFTICRRIWLNDLRAQKIRLGAGVIPAQECDLRAKNCDPVQNIFATEVFNKVMALPDAQRETVLLTYVEGFSYKDTAAILDIPIGTVMSRLSAARKALAALNKDDE